MSMHDGYAKCTQLIVSLSHNNGLMYILKSYLFKLFLHMYMVLNSRALKIWFRICATNMTFCTGVHNQGSPYSTGLKKRLVSFLSPALKHTFTEKHTLLYTV